MESIERWNFLLPLPAKDDGSKVLELLQLPQETTEVFHLSYIFGLLCKEKGQEVRA